jgi:hypothetical protein
VEKQKKGFHQWFSKEQPKIAKNYDQTMKKMLKIFARPSWMK